LNGIAFDDEYSGTLKSYYQQSDCTSVFIKLLSFDFPNLQFCMLTKLHIRHYAIIDELQVDFEQGLNIITGETGAGKSILMGALGLILGDRADSSIVKGNDVKCVVEGYFKMEPNAAIQTFFHDNDLDEEPLIVIRREVTPNGKTRSFINDTPVALGQVKTLGLLLVDLHQQFDTLEINTVNFQREVLDAFAGNTADQLKLRNQFEQFTIRNKKLEQLIAAEQAANKEKDYLQFLLQELEELALQDDEMESLESEIQVLQNAEQIKEQLYGMLMELKEGEQPLIAQLKAIASRSKSLADYQTDMADLYSRLQAATIEINDIADEVEKIADKVHHDPERISIVNDRLSAGYTLYKKHSVNSTAQLLTLQHELKAKLQEHQSISAGKELLEKEVADLKADCLQTATLLSKSRKEYASVFAKHVNSLLSRVGMPNALLKVNIGSASLSASGIDEISFLFDANKSNQFEPLSKVASGGELSRLMLSMKSLVAQKLQLPTLIFDEIDTGISGEAARQVGQIMKELALNHQLIAITHQPQIAAKADVHFYVYKDIKADKIVTHVKRLSQDEKILAIAQMLSGEKPTAAAMKNAQEMVGN
jgi:DNA repair protein RecN (Recombination protein N)